MWRLRIAVSPYTYWITTSFLIVALVVRALVPAGFMPTDSRMGQGIAITMCVVGLSTPTVIYLDLNPSDTAPTHSEHPSLDCALGTILGGFLPLFATLPIWPKIALFVQFFLVWGIAPPRRRSECLGASLGARGPPESPLNSRLINYF